MLLFGHWTNDKSAGASTSSRFVNLQCNADEQRGGD